MMFRYFGLILVAGLCGSASAAAPFLIGGDVSLLPFIESKGGTFRDNGVIAPADHILVENGANTFRLRLFVNPNLNYSATNGAIQDLNSTIAMAQRLKASGAKVLLDFQYSDTWADPGTQTKPAAWASLDAASLSTQLRTYTRQSLEAFAAAGALPDLVQVGNETTNGMLWPTGQVVYTGSTATQNASWAAFGGLLNSAISGVRDVDAETGKHTLVAIHVDGGDVSGRAQYYFNKLATVGGVSPSTYDIAGLSFYPTSTSALSNLQANMSYAATTLGRQVMVLETNSPWKGTATGSGYAATAAGQSAFFAAVRDAVLAVPNGRGLGAMWWYPESIQVSGVTIWKGGAISLFDDSGGDALPAVSTMQLPAPTWAVDSDGAWSNASNWALGVPDGTGATARFGSAIAAARSITLDSPRTVGTLRFQGNSTYTLAGASTLTLANGTSPSRVDVLDGSHAIDVPIVVSGAVELNAAWTSILTLGQPVGVNGSLTKLGSGTLVIANARVGAAEVSDGTLRLSQQASSSVIASSVVASLLIQPHAQLDLTNNTLVIDPLSGGGTPAMLATLRGELADGRLFSSMRTDDLSVGYAIDPAADRVAFDGLLIDGSSIVVRLTLTGDANVDGMVDFNDLVLLAQSYGTATGRVWSQGDFNYDGTVDFNDLVALAQHYSDVTPAGAIAGTSSDFQSDWILARSLAPEPTSLCLAFATVAMPRRKRRSASDVS